MQASLILVGFVQYVVNFKEEATEIFLGKRKEKPCETFDTYENIWEIFSKKMHNLTSEVRKLPSFKNIQGDYSSPDRVGNLTRDLKNRCNDNKLPTEEMEQVSSA